MVSSEQLDSRPMHEQEAEILKILQVESTNSNDEQLMKTKEQALYKLSKLYVDMSNPKKIQELIYNNQNLISAYPKPRQAKIFKALLDDIAEIKSTEELRVEIYNYLISIYNKDQQAYQRHRVEIRLGQTYFILKKYQLAINLVENLLSEARKDDDKNVLVEANLLLSQIYYELHNYSKAKVAFCINQAQLIAARTSSNAIYVSVSLQAEIDLQNGILLSEAKDYATAYSYFYEAFEAMDSIKDKKALRVFVYMLLCKVMTNSHDDVIQLLTGKYGLKYSGQELDTMMQISKAQKEGSLTQLQNIINQSQSPIMQDQLLSKQIQNLHEQLMEKNIFKAIEPYSKIYLSDIQRKLNIDPNVLQKRLSGLILDKKLNATLDQQNDCLIILEGTKSDNLYEQSFELLENLEEVIDKLFLRVKAVKS